MELNIGRVSLNRIKVFLEAHRNQISNRDYATIYKALDTNNYGFSRCAVTEILLASGIDPLLYMNYVPNHYLDCSDIDYQIKIPSHITEIGIEAFYNFEHLRTIEIPDKVETIKERAFYACNDLHKVSIGRGVKSIGKLAFLECRGLSDITYNGTVEQWKQIKKGDLAFQPNIAKITCQDGTVDG